MRDGKRLSTNQASLFQSQGGLSKFENARVNNQLLQHCINHTKTSANFRFPRREIPAQSDCSMQAWGTRYDQSLRFVLDPSMIPVF